MAEASSEPGPSFIVQAEDAPVFRVLPDNGQVLICDGCREQTLIQGYCPPHFIDLGIICKKCGHVTTTPSVVRGQMIPHRPVLIPTGRYLLSTADLRLASEGGHDATMVSERALWHEQQTLWPRPATTPRRELDQVLLEKAAAEYDRLTGGKYAAQAAAVAKAAKHNRASAMARTEAFAWATWRLERALSEPVFDLRSGEIGMAMSFVSAFEHIIETWGHHPLFTDIMRTVSDGRSFQHTVAQLIAAAVLHTHGNRVALVVADGVDGRLADLALRFTPEETLHIEVKAPDLLADPAAVSKADARALEVCILAALKSAKGQITSDKRGILVVAGGALPHGAHDRLIAAAECALRRKGHDNKGVAGIVVICGAPPAFRIVPDGSVQHDVSYSYAAVRNSRFAGDNPLVVEAMPDISSLGRPR